MTLDAEGCLVSWSTFQTDDLFEFSFVFFVMSSWRSFVRRLPTRSLWSSILYGWTLCARWACNDEISYVHWKEAIFDKPSICLKLLFSSCIVFHGNHAVIQFWKKADQKSVFVCFYVLQVLVHMYACVCVCVCHRFWCMCVGQRRNIDWWEINMPFAAICIRSGTVCQ